MESSPACVTLTERQRIFGTSRGLLLQWRDRPHLLFDVYTFGAPPAFCTIDSTPEQNFVRMMRHFEAQYWLGAHGPEDAPAMNAGLSDRAYGEVYEAICQFVKMVAAKGRWRPRKDSRG